MTLTAGASGGTTISVASNMFMAVGKRLLIQKQIINDTVWAMKCFMTICCYLRKYNYFYLEILSLEEQEVG